MGWPCPGGQNHGGTHEQEVPRVVGEGWQERGHGWRAEEGAGASWERRGTVIPELLAEIGLQEGWVALGGRGVAGEGLGTQRGGVDITDKLLGAVEIQLGGEGSADAVVPSRGG